MYMQILCLTAKKHHVIGYGLNAMIGCLAFHKKYSDHSTWWLLSGCVDTLNQQEKNILERVSDTVHTV